MRNGHSLPVSELRILPQPIPYVLFRTEEAVDPLTPAVEDEACWRRDRSQLPFDELHPYSLSPFWLRLFRLHSACRVAMAISTILLCMPTSYLPLTVTS